MLTGLYLLETMERLKAVDAGGAEYLDRAVFLGEVEVK